VIDAGFANANSCASNHPFTIPAEEPRRTSCNEVSLSDAMYKPENAEKRVVSISPILKRPPGSVKLPLADKGAWLHLYLTTRCHFLIGKSLLEASSNASFMAGNTMER